MVPLFLLAACNGTEAQPRNRPRRPPPPKRRRPPQPTDRCARTDSRSFRARRSQERPYNGVAQGLTADGFPFLGAADAPVDADRTLGLPVTGLCPLRVSGRGRKSLTSTCAQGQVKLVFRAVLNLGEGSVRAAESRGVRRAAGTVLANAPTALPAPTGNPPRRTPVVAGLQQFATGAAGASTKLRSAPASKSGRRSNTCRPPMPSNARAGLPASRPSRSPAPAARRARSVCRQSQHSRRRWTKRAVSERVNAMAQTGLASRIAHSRLGLAAAAALVLGLLLALSHRHRRQ